MSLRRILTLALALALSVPARAETKPPLYPNLTGYHRAVATKSAEAQKYFDQGLTLFYGFNLEAAIPSFAEAARLDPKLAMAWWGQALAWGPHINNPEQDSAAAQAAVEAIQKAEKLAKKASPVERELIHALAKRYASPPPKDRKALNQAYADAMREVWRNHPADADVGALFADAMMNLRPWHLWTSAGEPQPGTAEIMATLEKVMALQPDHPGATHFYIHTVEASPFPELALPAADRLRNRVPGAGHLVHMPAHIDIRVGHYAAAILANQKGIAADSQWISAGGFYTMYRAHNFHFLAYAAMFDGQQALALEAARDMVAQVPLEVIRAYPDFMEAYFGVPYHVLVRFGLWQQMLSEPAPPADFFTTTATWHYGRTVALASLGRVDEAAREFGELQTACAAIPESRLFGNNTARGVMDIGLATAEGELEYRRGNYQHAFDLLYKGVALDDSLQYDEPWGWMMPVRHALGALLLEQNRLAEAEVVYREDLRRHPNNGWALKGLAECLEKTGRTGEAELATAKFNDAWARSDIRIQASCFCRRPLTMERVATPAK